MRFRSNEYLTFIRGHPCLACGARWGVQAHHVKIGTERGMGIKSGDDMAVPLCFHCHEKLHRTGNESKYWASVGVEVHEWIREVWDAWNAERAESGDAPCADDGVRTEGGGEV